MSLLPLEKNNVRQTHELSEVRAHNPWTLDEALSPSALMVCGTVISSGLAGQREDMEQCLVEGGIAFKRYSQVKGMRVQCWVKRGSGSDIVSLSLSSIRPPRLPEGGKSRLPRFILFSPPRPQMRGSIVNLVWRIFASTKR